MSAVAWLWRREVVRFFRQRSRILGALATPVVFWVLIGSGFSPSYRGEGADYLQYLFPGSAIMILLFAAMFSTISIIEDRREGFLQGVLASPAPRGALVFAKLLGGTTVAVFQAGLFLSLGPLAGVKLDPAGAARALAVMLPVAFGLTGLGFLVAWRMESTQGFHAVLNLLLMPMWALSGALFPLSGSGWLGWAGRLNPLAYGYRSLREAIAGGDWLPPLAIWGAFALVIFVADVAAASKRE